MKQREIIKTVRGKAAVDGAGVHLTRVLSRENVYDFDPFLMLDSFDSKHPADYVAGFPMHPHRGIETITYLISGEMEHKDSLGNRGTIRAGESQWMTAGSGILHEEMPQPSERMLGFQLWLNLAKADKMTDPAYLSITGDQMPVVAQEGVSLRVLSGRLGDAEGVTPRHIPATIYDVTAAAGRTAQIAAKPDETVFVFLIEGDASIAGQDIAAKTAVLFGAGDHIAVTAKTALRFIYFSAKPLHEPIAWGGPLVMNTQEELALAFDELRAGTFIKHG